MDPIAPSYTPWTELEEPVGCSLCGALVSRSTTDVHDAFHRDLA